MAKPQTRREPAPLREVFGVNRQKNTLSYIERAVDHNFKKALQDGQYSVVVIYGTSKQGKSSLRRHVLPEPFCTFVPATHGMTQEMLYRNILNQAQAAGPLRFTKSGSVSVGAEAEFKLPEWLSFLSAKANVTAERSTERTWEEVGIDLADAGGVARHYANVAGQRPIVIDNFHYFSPEMQRSLAIDIRAFEEFGVKFVIMGTWKARNYLEMQNHDLTGTVCPLSIEPWTNEDFTRVIDTGLANLRVSFTGVVRQTLIERAIGNIGLLQRALRELLDGAEIDKKPGQDIVISDAKVVRNVYRDISTELLDGTIDKLNRISQIGDPWLAGKTRTYYILKAFIHDQESTRIEGVSLPRLFERTNKLIATTEPDRALTDTAFGTLVKRDLLAGQQSRIETPIIACDLEGYSGTGRLSAVDSWFLITLRNHREEILQRF
jgi:hypothetical protein